MTLNARFRSQPLLAILTVCALTGCTPHPRPVPATMSAPTTAPWHYRQHLGTEIRTEHWIVYTTASARSLKWMDSLPTFLEACYSQYEILVPAPDASRSLTLYLFANGIQWDDYAAKMGVPPTSIDVLSQVGGFSQQDVSAVYVTSPLATLRAIAHEGLHQYLWQHGRTDLPTWVSEGLATLAEGFVQQDKQFVFEPRFNDNRFQQARAGVQRSNWLDLHSLLTLEGFDKTPTPAIAARTYLAQVWTLAAFLQNDQYYQKGFEQLRRDLATDSFNLKMQGYMAAGKDGLTPGEAAFRLYITEDESTFWTRYYDKTIQYLSIVK
jgi:hypothetical protein